MRVIVVGGGVIGLACAWQLARAGAQVQVLDAAPEAREASWAAAGMLAPHHEATTTDAAWRLGCESLAAWPQFARELGGDAVIDHRQSGGLVPIIDEADAEPAARHARELAQAGVAVDWWSAAQVRSRETALAEVVRGAWWIGGGQVDPRRVLQALNAACELSGVALRYGARVEAIDAGRVHLAGAELLEAEQVVLASGAWTPALAQATGLALRGEPVKGQMLRLAAGDDLLRHFLHSHHAYLVQRRGAGVVVGSTMVETGFDRSPDAQAIERLAGSARRLLPQLRDAAILEHWTGLRPRLSGGRPVISQVRPGLIIATGHFRNGILLTPATAQAVTALAFGQAPSSAAGAFAALPA